MSALPINPNETAFLLIDFQAGITELAKTVEQASLRAAAISLAKLARVSGVPTIVSSQSNCCLLRRDPNATLVRLYLRRWSR